ncbi:MAG: YlmC/YmxH family sporulation protein [Clostridiales bacterium]|nr:YlmC/YmxH family sporulation protein [Clostridiales bacterium]
MVYCFSDLMCKEVINIKTGTKIGYVDDLELTCPEAKIISIIVFGRSKFFGIFGREPDTVIKWCDIEIVGEDTILVCFDEPRKRHKRSGFSMETLFT